MSTADLLTSALSEMHGASVGVMHLRTCEPWRAWGILDEWGTSRGLPVRLWTVSGGWSGGQRLDPAGADPASAIKSACINPSPALLVMMHPQFAPIVVQAVLDAARGFPLGQSRMVLITPVSCELPEEIRREAASLDLKLPDAADLLSAATQLLDTLGRRKPRYTVADLDRIASAGLGMTASEYDGALGRALVSLQGRLPRLPAADLAVAVMRIKSEATSRSGALELLRPAAMADVGGLPLLKAWLAKRVSACSPEARAAGVDAPRGVALVGPPGTGKSHAARAAADVLGVPLLRLDVSKCMASLVGQSESRMRDALATAEATAPCVLLLDEVDKVFDSRSSGDSGVGKRVMGTLLTWLDEPRGVFTVMTLNRTAGIPAEMLRRGRLDAVFAVGMPDAAASLEVLQIHLRKRGKAVAGLEDVAAQSAGYVPAELESAVKDAILESFSDGQPLAAGRILDCLRSSPPLSSAFRAQFQAMAEWAKDNARAAA